MEIAHSLRKLWSLRLWVAVVAVVAVLGSLTLTQNVSLFPPSLQTKQGIEFGAASTSMLVDSPGSAIGDLRKPLSPLTSRAALVALLIRSEPVQRRISKAVGVPMGTIATSVTIPVPGSTQPPNLSAGAQASALVGQSAEYQIAASPEPDVPIVDIYTQAPDGGKAVELAGETTRTVSGYLKVLQRGGSVPTLSRVSLRALGSPSGGDVNSGAGFSATLLAFLAIFIVGCFVVLAISRIAEDIQMGEELDRRAQTNAGLAPWGSRGGDGGDNGSPRDPQPAAPTQSAASAFDFDLESRPPLD